MKTALIIYLVIGIIDIVLGARFITSNQFLPYHSEAIGASWQEVDSGTQTLILALMKVAGGGWLALGCLTLMLGLVAMTRGSIVARWALPTGTLIFYLVCFTATWEVYQESGASTPWGPTLGLIVFALFAFFMDAPWSSRVRDIK